MRGHPTSGFRLTRRRIEQGILTPDLLQMHMKLQKAKEIASRFKIEPHPTADYTADLRRALAELEMESNEPSQQAA